MRGLTNQLRLKDSPVRQFFTKYEERSGARECLGQLQSTKALIQPVLDSPSRSYYTFAGISVDYLIRYIAKNNYLDFDETVARGGIPHTGNYGTVYESLWVDQYLFNNVARVYLDGREVDELAVYSATALAMLDCLRRSGMLPRSFSQEIPSEKKDKIANLQCGGNIHEKTILWLFDEYCFESLHWESYVKDVLAITKLFTEALKAPKGELFQAEFSILNRAMANSGLVGGADFDCIIEKNGRHILTDIKNTKQPLTIESLRQLVGYALLHDEVADGFKVSDVGIYFSRSGSFKYLPVDTIVRECLPSFRSIQEAKFAFVNEVGLGVSSS